MTLYVGKISHAGTGKGHRTGELRETEGVTDSQTFASIFGARGRTNSYSSNNKVSMIEIFGDSYNIYVDPTELTRADDLAFVKAHVSSISNWNALSNYMEKYYPNEAQITLNKYARNVNFDGLTNKARQEVVRLYLGVGDEKQLKEMLEKDDEETIFKDMVARAIKNQGKKTFTTTLGGIEFIATVAVKNVSVRTKDSAVKVVYTIRGVEAQGSASYAGKAADKKVFSAIKKYGMNFFKDINDSDDLTFVYNFDEIQSKEVRVYQITSETAANFASIIAMINDKLAKVSAEDIGIDELSDYSRATTIKKLFGELGISLSSGSKAFLDDDDLRLYANKEITSNEILARYNAEFADIIKKLLLVRFEDNNVAFDVYAQRAVENVSDDLRGINPNEILKDAENIAHDVVDKYRDGIAGQTDASNLLSLYRYNNSTHDKAIIDELSKNLLRVESDKQADNKDNNELFSLVSGVVVARLDKLSDDVWKEFLAENLIDSESAYAKTMDLKTKFITEKTNSLTGSIMAQATDINENNVDDVVRSYLDSHRAVISQYYEEHFPFALLLEEVKTELLQEVRQTEPYNKVNVRYWQEEVSKLADWQKAKVYQKDLDKFIAERTPDWKEQLDKQDRNELLQERWHDLKQELEKDKYSFNIFNKVTQQSYGFDFDLLNDDFFARFLQKGEAIISDFIEEKAKEIYDNANSNQGQSIPETPAIAALMIYQSHQSELIERVKKATLDSAEWNGEIESIIASLATFFKNNKQFVLDNIKRSRFMTLSFDDLTEILHDLWKDQKDDYDYVEDESIDIELLADRVMEGQATLTYPKDDNFTDTYGLDDVKRVIEANKEAFTKSKDKTTTFFELVADEHEERRMARVRIVKDVLNNSLPSRVTDYSDVYDKLLETAKERGYDPSNQEHVEMLKKFLLSVEPNLSNAKDLFEDEYVERELSSDANEFARLLMTDSHFDMHLKQAINTMPYFEDNVVNESDVVEYLKNPEMSIPEISQKITYGLNGKDLSRVANLYRTGNATEKQRVLDLLEDINFHSERFQLETEDYTAEDIADRIPALDHTFMYVSDDNKPKEVDRATVLKIINKHFVEFKQALYQRKQSDLLINLLLLQDNDADLNDLESIVDEIMQGQVRIEYTEKGLTTYYYQNEVTNFVANNYKSFADAKDKRELFFALKKDDFEDKLAERKEEIRSHLANFFPDGNQFDLRIENYVRRKAEEKGYNPDIVKEYRKFMDYCGHLLPVVNKAQKEFAKTYDNVFVDDVEDTFLNDFINSSEFENAFNSVPMPQWVTDEEVSNKGALLKTAHASFETFANGVIDENSKGFDYSFNVMLNKAKMDQWIDANADSLYEDFVDAKGEDSALTFEEYLKEVDFNKVVVGNFDAGAAKDTWVQKFMDKASSLGHSSIECVRVAKEMTDLELWSFASAEIKNSSDSTVEQIFEKHPFEPEITVIQ